MTGFAVADPLKGRVALVTGAESGIGAACAAALAAAGADVAAWYFRDQGGAEETAALVQGAGRQCILVQGDIRDERSVESGFDASAALGLPDILVNSAGLNQSGVAIADMTLAQWQLLVATDLTGAFLTCRRFIRDLRAGKKRGSIINISSIHAEDARVGGGDYCAAKGGLRMLTRTLALEAASLGVTVNDIAPGMIMTPMNARAEGDAAYRADLEASIPIGRAGRAEEVAQLAVYLASPAADYITGASLTIDGGLSLVLGQGA